MNRLQPLTSNLQLLPPKARILMRAIAIALIGCAALDPSGNAAWADSSPDFGQAGRSGGDHDSGATRGDSLVSGDCASSSESLLPLVPSSVGGGYTTQARPTFWVYSPYSLSENSPVFFALMNEENLPIHEARLPILEAGIYSIELPPSVELQLGNTYEWYVQVYCGDPDQMEPPLFVSAWSTRVATPLAPEPPTQMSPVEESSYYAEQLIWYDSLSILGHALRQESGDRDTVEAAWDSLLELPSVQLEDLTDAPLID